MFGNSIFKEIIKMRSLGWALIQYDCIRGGLYTRKNLGHRHVAGKPREDTEEKAIREPRREASEEPTLLTP